MYGLRTVMGTLRRPLRRLRFRPGLLVWTLYVGVSVRDGSNAKRGNSMGSDVI
jgi:hypothetical protein